jgi:SOS-response transcriptional repressor LexA
MSAMNIGLEVRRRRKANGWTLEQLVDRIEKLGGRTDTGNLSRLERGQQGYTDDTLRVIAAALGCSISDLFSGENVEITPIGSRRVPLINYVQAGHWTEVTDPYTVGDAAEWLLTDLELSTSAFALKIKGDSMLPDFREGDVVVIDPSVAPLPGDFVVAKNGDHEATFKKFRPLGINEQGNTIFKLVPLNEDYPFMRSDIEPIRIIGTMVEHRRYRKK